MKFGINALWMALALTAVSAQAGVFVGGDIKSVDADVCESGAFSGPEYSYSCDDKDNGFGLEAGYRFNNIIALALDYSDLGSVSSRLSGDFGFFSFSSRGSAELSRLGLSALVGGAVSEHMRLYGRLGAYRWTAKGSSDYSDSDGDQFSDSDSASDVNYFYGAGGEYRFNQLALFGEYQLMKDFGDDGEAEGTDVKSFSFGMRYYF